MTLSSAINELGQAQAKLERSQKLIRNRIQLSQTTFRGHSSNCDTLFNEYSSYERIDACVSSLKVKVDSKLSEVLNGISDEVAKLSELSCNCNENSTSSSQERRAFGPESLEKLDVQMRHLTDARVEKLNRLESLQDELRNLDEKAFEMESSIIETKRRRYVADFEVGESYSELAKKAERLERQLGLLQCNGAAPCPEKTPKIAAFDEMDFAMYEIRHSAQAEKLALEDLEKQINEAIPCLETLILSCIPQADRKLELEKLSSLKLKVSMQGQG